MLAQPPIDEQTYVAVCAAAINCYLQAERLLQSQPPTSAWAKANLIESTSDKRISSHSQLINSYQL